MKQRFVSCFIRPTYFKQFAENLQSISSWEPKRTGAVCSSILSAGSSKNISWTWTKAFCYLAYTHSALRQLTTGHRAVYCTCCVQVWETSLLVHIMFSSISVKDRQATFRLLANVSGSLKWQNKLNITFSYTYLDLVDPQDIKG